MTCHRFPLLKPPRPRGLLGVGATIGPIRALAIAVPCVVGGGLGIAKLPPAAPPAALAPDALGLDRFADPVAIPAPPGLALFGLALAGLALLRR